MRSGGALAIALIAAFVLVGCGKPPKQTAAEPAPSTAVQDAPSLLPSAPAVTASPSGSTSPKASRKARARPGSTLKKTVAAGGDTGSGTTLAPSGDGVPTKGAGTFTAAPGGTDVVGTGAVLVKYRVEVEDGIVWGTNPVWTPASF